ncbi:MAG: DUF4062 domain-containing protein [Candidatus Omnitrophota bacterium]
MKPRVFVSSIMEGFSEYRRSAKEAIERSDADPVLIEDFPSASSSPRNACLDGVKSCDFLVLIVGLRGGFVAPSGKLVIEEEYEEAVREKMRVLVFVQEGDRDEGAQKFVNKISNYVDGFYRNSFSNPFKLGEAVEQSLKLLTKGWSDMDNEIHILEEEINEHFNVNNETSLRFAIVPTRKGEVIDPVELDSEDFKRNVYDMAHQRGVDLFSYEKAKEEARIEVDHIIFTQKTVMGHEDDFVCLKISTNGMIVIDINVTGREKERSFSSLSSMVIHVDMLKSCLAKCFSFCNQIMEVKDPYKRFDPLVYNVTLNGIGYRNIVDEYPRGNSITMRTFGEDQEKAFDASRKVSRNDIMHPEKEINAVVSMLKRRVK